MHGAQHREFKHKVIGKLMIKLMTTLTISAIASILIIGGFAMAAPNAYSTWGGDDDDDCGSSYGNHDDDCDNDKPDDPCDCEKPDTLKFIFSTPSEEEASEFKIEVFKKLNHIDNPDKKLTSIIDVTHDIEYQLQSSSFGKDKLNSNTAFAIYKVVEGVDDELVASMEIHTSCSQPLYKGLVVSNNGYSLGVTDGLKKDKTSIPEFDPLICEDETKPKKMGKIIVRKAITNDNGGDAIPADFTITLTDIDTNEEFILVHDQDDSTLNVNEVPVGTYKLSETIVDTVTGTYTTVLIAGDTKCPAMVDEPFTIKKGKKISCTIYNDDNGDGSGGPGGEPGVAFGFNGFEWNNTNLNSAGNECPNMPTGGCIEQNGPVFVIVDPLLQKTDNTIVTWSMTGKNLNVITAHTCTIIGIFESQTVTTVNGNGDTVPANGFGLFCSVLPGGGADWNINYAFIETDT